MTNIRTCRCGAKIDFDDTIGLINHTTSPEHEAAIAALPPDDMAILRGKLTGLRVKGRGMDGWLVEHKLTDRKLEPLEAEGYRLVPSGPKHTIVSLPHEKVEPPPPSPARTVGELIDALSGFDRDEKIAVHAGAGVPWDEVTVGRDDEGVYLALQV